MQKKQRINNDIKRRLKPNRNLIIKKQDRYGRTKEPVRTSFK